VIKYLIEIKNRAFLLLFTYLFLVVAIYYYKEIILFLIIQSKTKFDYTSSDYFIFTDVTEIFSVYIKLILFFSTQIIIIFLLYHFIVFLIPALFNNESFYLKIFFKLFLFIWAFSAIISTKVLIPVTWDFFLSFQKLVIQTTSLNIYFEAKLLEYFYFYAYFYFITIIYFQIGILLFLILNYFNISLLIIKKFRKVNYFFFVLMSTILCPDMNSQLIISFIVILNYEIFIFIFCFSKATS
jgi:sec-independent protein translocase protein TatC